MEDWVTLEKVYPLEEQARKAAQIIRVTESRLLSAERGAQYDIETEVLATHNGWQIKWRKVLIGYDSGCGGCGSCQSQDEGLKKASQPGKVLMFKPKEPK